MRIWQNTFNDLNGGIKTDKIRNLTAALLAVLFIAASAAAMPQTAPGDVYVSGYTIYASPGCGKMPCVAVNVTNGNCEPARLVGWAVGFIDQRCPIQKDLKGLTQISATAQPCETLPVVLQWGGKSFNKLILIDNDGCQTEIAVPCGIDWSKNTRVSLICGEWIVEELCGCVRAPCNAGC